MNTVTTTEIVQALAPGDEVTLGGQRYVIEYRDGNRVGVLLPSPNTPNLSLIHISEPTRLRRISYAVFCLKKKK